MEEFRKKLMEELNRKLGKGYELSEIISQRISWK